MGPTWPLLLMYESHGMGHTGFLQVDGGQRDPRDRGVTSNVQFLLFGPPTPLYLQINLFIFPL